ncbi:hypothetical protein [Arboricoccus pini]|uniref:hypothetical protein n=1 Tax=Arboricoccus pini TaxID=1963835 RepID=UPI0013FD731C|nr:hypothetical protein [Arboricoccus pini]
MRQWPTVTAANPARQGPTEAADPDASGHRAENVVFLAISRDEDDVAFLHAGDKLAADNPSGAPGWRPMSELAPNLPGIPAVDQVVCRDPIIARTLFGSPQSCSWWRRPFPDHAFQLQVTILQGQ